MLNTTVIQAFPPTASVASGTYNAGVNSDRSLALGVENSGDENAIRVFFRVSENDASAVRIISAVEARQDSNL